jgi:predicted amidohydrolase
MRIALAQINNTVGDLEANAAGILDFARRAEHAGAELVALPELAFTGYPPRDLVEKRSFLPALQLFSMAWFGTRRIPPPLW